MDSELASGKSKELNKPFPPELSTFNWGAFFLNWLWGIFNRVWIALVFLVLALIPLVGGFLCLIFSIYLGVKGNELAWKNRKFESAEQFKAVQKAWTLWGIGLFIASLVFGLIGAIFFGVFSTNSMLKQTQQRASNARQKAYQHCIDTQSKTQENLNCQQNLATPNY